MSPRAARIALVCDWLTTPGGAEKVLLELHKMYPSAPIYTSQYRPKQITWFKDAKVKTGWLNIFPARLRKLLGPLRNLYFSHLDLSQYDIVISVTGAEAKGIKLHSRRFSTASRPGEYEIYLPEQHQPVHICYCHVPTQYYWGMSDQYLKNPGFGKLNGLVRTGFKALLKPLRAADLRAADRPDLYVTISEYSAKELEKYYGRPALVVPPPVDTAAFAAPAGSNPQEIHKKSTEKADFSTRNPQKSETFPQVFHSQTQSFPQATPDAPFVIACRQVTWKRCDLAISACLAANAPLLVIGDGPEHERLVELAGGSPLIRFIPWLSQPELAAYLRGARAFLFPSREPFGLAAVEALAAGCPVIAFSEGGSRDFIQSGKNGLLFSEQTVASLLSVIQQSNKVRFDRAKVAKTAEIYDSAYFRADMSAIIANFLPETPAEAPNA